MESGQGGQGQQHSCQQYWKEGQERVPESVDDERKVEEGIPCLPLLLPSVSRRWRQLGWHSDIQM